MYRPLKTECLESLSRIDTPINQTYHPMESDKIKYFESILSPEYWEYRDKWEEYPKEHIVSYFPLHLDIEATTACDLKCIMCPRTASVKAGNFWKIEMFDFDTYKRLIDDGVSNGLCSVKYNYMGEPLLNPRLVEMIEYAKQAGVIDVMFNTNATHLTEEMSYELIASGLDKLFFSFDSPYREKYNQIRVGADYDKVLANIRRFGEIRDEMESVKPLTRVTMVLMKRNKDEWDAFRELFEPIVDVVAYGDYVDHIGQNKPEYSSLLPKSRRNKFCCALLWQRMFISPDGVATVCCLDSMRSLQVGNIFEQSVHDIWVGEKYQRLRDLHSSGRANEIPTCVDCPLMKY